MLDRVMRSGRTYDPGLVPTRRTRKSKATEALETEAPEVPQGPEDNQTDGEHTENAKGRLITFGSFTANDRNEIAPVLRGTGKRKGVALAESGRVKVSPSVYQALTNSAPPIRRIP
ncbi:hypothetical protein V565_324920, partial [Rhizoctonia solani 123E]